MSFNSLLYSERNLTRGTALRGEPLTEPSLLPPLRIHGHRTTYFHDVVASFLPRGFPGSGLDRGSAS